MEKKKNKQNKMVAGYFGVGMLLLLGSVFLSWLVYAVLMLVGWPDDMAAEIAGFMEGTIGAISAVLLFYELKKGNQTEEKQNNIDQASFVTQCNQFFIQDEKMHKVEVLLEKYARGGCESLIDDENRQDFINYLVFLEGMAPLVESGVLELGKIDDLFAYRFFLAVNNKAVQENELCKYPDYYRGCFKLYKRWKKYREERNYPILQEDTALDRWTKFSAYAEQTPECRRMTRKDNRMAVARLLYDTDPYIYPALLGNVGSENQPPAKSAIRKFARMMLRKCVFHYKNILVAEREGMIVGAAVVLEAPPLRRIPRYLAEGKSGRDVRKNYFDHFSKPGKHVGEDTAYVLCLCVAKDERGRKIGSLLMNHITRNCQSSKLRLHVLENNDAIKLYEKHGFKRIRTEDGYIYDDVPPKCIEMIREKTKPNNPNAGCTGSAKGK